MIVLSHTEQADRLRLSCPEAMDRVSIAGDVCFDQLTHSRALRSSYRRALGIGPAQYLVVISSTWGPESLFGTWPQVASELAEQLPVDEFRIAVALHPNIWFHHSRWQVNQWTAAWRRSGVAVLSGMDDWRSAVVAADLVVGDHGSVSFYSTALGNPLLLASAPLHTVAADSPIASLLKAAPQLNPGPALLPQVRDAIAQHEPDRYRDITQLTTSKPGQARAAHRAIIYEMVGLPEPDQQASTLLLPGPDYAIPQPTSCLVEVGLTGPRTASITRFPAQRLRRDLIPPRGTHLVASTDEPARRWLELADVIVGTPGAHTAEWIAQTFAAFPGCLLACAQETSPRPPGTWMLGDRTGTVLKVDGDGELFASAALHALVNGRPLATLAGRWSLTAGPRHEDVAVTTIAAG